MVKISGKMKNESPNRASLDCEKITLEQVKAIIGILKHDEQHIDELRINNVVFKIDDPDILIELAYGDIEWNKY